MFGSPRPRCSAAFASSRHNWRPIQTLGTPNNSHGHTRTDRIPGRSDHRHLAVHPAGAAGDLLLRCTTHTLRTGCRERRRNRNRRRSQAGAVREAATVPGDRRPGAQLQPGHPRRDVSAVAVASSSGRDQVGRACRTHRDRPWTDLPSLRGATGKALQSDSAASDEPGQKRFRPGAGPRRVVCALRRPGACRDRRRRSHRLDRVGHRRADDLLRDRRRRPVAVLCTGRSAGRRAGRQVPPPPAPNSPNRRHRDVDLRGRVGVQRASQAATGHPRLHEPPAGQSRCIRGHPGETEPRWHRQRPEPGAVELQ